MAPRSSAEQYEDTDGDLSMIVTYDDGTATITNLSAPSEGGPAVTVLLTHDQVTRLIRQLTNAL